jgi:hypothetical protein
VLENSAPIILKSSQATPKYFSLIESTQRATQFEEDTRKLISEILSNLTHNASISGSSEGSNPTILTFKADMETVKNYDQVKSDIDICDGYRYNRCPILKFDPTF